MGLYLKQRVLTLNDAFFVCDETGDKRYRIQGDVFSWGKKLHLYDLQGAELACIDLHTFATPPRYVIHRPDTPAVEVSEHIGFFFHAFRTKPFGWEAKGRLMPLHYRIRDGKRTVATVDRDTFAVGDTYYIDGLLPGDEVMALAVALIIDAAIA